MNCMKCGRNIGAEQVFCNDCLAEMEKFPVKPDVVVKLPTQYDFQQAKRVVPQRQGLSEKEQIPILKRRIKRLWRAVWFFAVLSLLLGALAAYSFLSPKGPLLGRNYSIITPSQSNQTN